MPEEEGERLTPSQMVNLLTDKEHEYVEKMDLSFGLRTLYFSAMNTYKTGMAQATAGEVEAGYVNLYRFYLLVKNRLPYHKDYKLPQHQKMMSELRDLINGVLLNTLETLQHRIAEKLEEQRRAVDQEQALLAEQLKNAEELRRQREQVYVERGEMKKRMKEESERHAQLQKQIEEAQESEVRDEREIDNTNVEESSLFPDRDETSPGLSSLSLNLLEEDNEEARVSMNQIEEDIIPLDEIPQEPEILDFDQYAIEKDLDLLEPELDVTEEFPENVEEVDVYDAENELDNQTDDIFEEKNVKEIAEPMQDNSNTDDPNFVNPPNEVISDEVNAVESISLPIRRKSNERGSSEESRKLPTRRNRLVSFPTKETRRKDLEFAAPPTKVIINEKAAEDSISESHYVNEDNDARSGLSLGKPRSSFSLKSRGKATLAASENGQNSTDDFKEFFYSGG